MLAAKGTAVTSSIDDLSAGTFDLPLATLDVEDYPDFVEYHGLRLDTVE